MSEPACCVPLAELMGPPPEAVHPDSERRDAVGVLVDAGLVALPVTDDPARLVGLLDEEDLLVLAEDPHLVEHEAEAMADHHAGVPPVVDDEGHLVGVPTRRGLLEAWWAGRLC
ncbi:MAG: CBS domain-containing protein [Actinomycetes bacterium]